ncbi:unnamed protein product [Parascedosporium putredinis]|uniref:UDP-glucose 6-dehydrogenase n=1 Tax=Parascedosporium putredinis TaxID=1442378 RepID=A0A9P1H0C1_9PEZI|nr:unnamed protein product [Parascedosporium putredinis]CAI7991643.1 unnamed protein product [Parascedosporium putredinis]
MDPIPSSVVDSAEYSLHDDSTAPTTPEGSLTFSPVLHATRAIDGTELDGMASLNVSHRDLGPSSAPHLAEVAARPIQVRNICCVGAGYVGGPTAAVIALQNPGIRVTVVDKDATRIRRWNSSHPPIYEPHLRQILRAARDGARDVVFSNVPLPGTTATETDMSECGSQCERAPEVMASPARSPNLFFSTDVAGAIAEADVVMIAVNTPTKTRGIGAGCATDMASFEAVTAEVARYARPETIIVEKSTVPCMTAELVEGTMAAHRPGVHFEILSNPEFLAAGTAVKDLLFPDRVIIGSSKTPSGQRAASALANVYAAWVPRAKIITTNVYSSELAKLVANAMLAQRISSINSVSAICERTGADVDEIARCVGQDQRIGAQFLRAGIGFGGSCFKKDVLSLVYLAESLGLPDEGEYWRQVIAILGYAFKKNTSDTRESPALQIIKTLVDEGARDVAVFDPACNPLVVREELAALLGPHALASGGGPVEVFENAYQACNLADAVVITTEFDEFRTPSAEVPQAPKTPKGVSPASRLVLARIGHAPSAKTANGAAATIPGGAKNKPKDPRPFESLEVSENDLLKLQWFLAKAKDEDEDDAHRCRSSASIASTSSRGAAFSVGGATKSSSSSNVGFDGGEYRPKERLDWARISPGGGRGKAGRMA